MSSDSNKKQANDSFILKYKNYLLVSIFMLISALAHLFKAKSYFADINNFFDGHVLFTTTDSYYYMNLVRDLVNGVYGAASSLGPAKYPAVAPPLSAFVAYLHSFFGVDVYNTAFFLSPLLATLIVPIVFLLVKQSVGKSIYPTIIAMLSGTFCYAFYARTTIGYYDTDSLNLVLTWALIYTAYSITIDLKNIKSWALFIFFSILFYYWWTPVAFSFIVGCVGMALFSYLSQQHLKEFWVSKKVQTSLLALIIIGGVCFGIPFVRDLILVNIASLKNHIKLILGLNDTPFVEMGAVISELGRSDFNEFINRLSGWYVGFFISVVGLGYIILKNAKVRFFIIFSTIGFTAISLYSTRFIMFLLPLYALGYAGFFVFTSEKMIEWKVWPKYGDAILTFILLLSLIPSAQKCLESEPTPNFSHNDGVLAQKVDQVASHDAQIWNWWDAGYFISHFSKRKVMIDGGSQDPYLSYITAVPLANPSPHVSRNWIKFFSVHRYGLHVLKAQIGSYAKSVEFLIKVFSNPQFLKPLLTFYGLKNDRDWKNYLFPQKEVYLVLYKDMLVKNSWLSVGRKVPSTDFKFKKFITRAPYNKSIISKSKGKIKVYDKEIAYNYAFTVYEDKILRDKGAGKKNVAVIIPAENGIYFMDNSWFNCLVFRLFYVNPANTPNFEMVVYNPFVGGVWKVK